MIVALPYPRYPFLDLLYVRRNTLVGASSRALDDLRAARERALTDASPDARLRAREAKAAYDRALRREGERESVSLAVRTVLVALYLLPDVKLPPYGVLAAAGRERVSNTSVSLAPCEPVYAALRARTGILRLHNLLDHALACPLVVEMASALFRLLPDVYDGVVHDACDLATKERAANHDLTVGNPLS